ncbi:hypothetical protein Skr01_43430 [Sphaerisporangium krabiense]|uniref:Uncharacterized protein (DUF1330 family) n=1 Tax=Sphaerisporangium krabiense TaxID=763782 RepID=A0A7W8Z0J0_9ACTN|nr:DUF1330 domain-containing protein [Sphaerisporangium krabiense]MBB5625233.1 uncharacterized protein (DUF1330 family) [Sphaerisporangium krabiense]GII64258.1 hypothetical protein Skr01_43430 [Sphaerisporangium krabiense]
MSAYAVATLRDVKIGPEITEYLEKIDATLEPFGGRFLIHGGRKEIQEGAWPGTLIVIGFPDMEHARGWYASEAYQRILGLRTGNSVGDAMLVDGVSEDHKATDVLAR